MYRNVSILHNFKTYFFNFFNLQEKLISRQDDKHSFCKIFIFVTYYMLLYLNNKQSMLLPNIFAIIQKSQEN